jgi:hypothetical protein
MSERFSIALTLSWTDISPIEDKFKGNEAGRELEDLSETFPFSGFVPSRRAIKSFCHVSAAIKEKNK